MPGPVGCGLCGVQFLTEAVRTVLFVQPGLRVWLGAIEAAISALAWAQAKNRDACAIHAAAFWRTGEELVAIRKDVDRHSAGQARRSPGAGGGCRPRQSDRLDEPHLGGDGVEGGAERRTTDRGRVRPDGPGRADRGACGVTLVAVARGSGFEVFATIRPG